MEARERLVVALDVDSLEKASELIDILSPEVDVFKVGIGPFTGFGEALLEKLISENKKIFLDLKFHDIPNTVANATRSATGKGVFMMNFHCLGGKEMLEAAAEAAKETYDESSAGEKPLLLGVTILTSMKTEDMRDLGITGNIEHKVVELARLAKEAGLDGVVASAKEAANIKKEIGKDFIVVTPGIRPAWASQDDQKRVLSPKEAVAGGADYIVVGRPIIQADDPLQAAKKIIEEMT